MARSKENALAGSKRQGFRSEPMRREADWWKSDVLALSLRPVPDIFECDWRGTPQDSEALAKNSMRSQGGFRARNTFILTTNK